MQTREELDDVAYENNEWLEKLPKHLHKTAIAMQDFFELQSIRYRRFSRSKMRAWIVEMRNRAWLSEHHCMLQRGISLFSQDPSHTVVIDAALDAPGLAKEKFARR